jgi:hypothetical protein
VLCLSVISKPEDEKASANWGYPAMKKKNIYIYIYIYIPIYCVNCVVLVNCAVLCIVCV